MEEKWVQILGTFFVSGALLNWFFPFCCITFTSSNKPNEKYNNFFMSIGGKINRKWYLINCVICLTILLGLAIVAHFLSNIVMHITLIPYLILVSIWLWGNVYKRFFSISDNKKFSLKTTIFFAFFCFVWQLLKSEKIDIIPINHFTISIDIIRLLIGFLLFVLPEKKINQLEQ